MTFELADDCGERSFLRWFLASLHSRIPLFGTYYILKVGNDGLLMTIGHSGRGRWRV